MLIVIKGAGDIATGIAVRLFRVGMKIVMTDLPIPTAIRRTVCFSEAIRNKTAEVEGVQAVYAKSISDVPGILSKGVIAVLADSEAECVKKLKPDVVVDAILAKRNLGTFINDATFVVGIGPGFTAGIDCNAVVETKRGHNLGRVIWRGTAAPNTGIPGNIGGYTKERVIRSPCAGVFRQVKKIGDMVKAGDIVATVENVPVLCSINGVIRGLLPDGTEVTKGMKSGDVDPRGIKEYCFTVSDKSMAVGGGVLEAILSFYHIIYNREICSLSGIKQSTFEKVVCKTYFL